MIVMLVMLMSSDDKFCRSCAEECGGCGGAIHEKLGLGATTNTQKLKLASSTCYSLDCAGTCGKSLCKQCVEAEDGGYQKNWGALRCLDCKPGEEIVDEPSKEAKKEGGGSRKKRKA
jgi:hypothetical protein